MRKEALKRCLALAPHAGLLGEILGKSLGDTGIADPPKFIDHAKLEANLKAAGYAIQYEPGAGHGTWVRVMKGEVLAARGFSDTPEDSLRQALYGTIREERAAKLVDLVRADNPGREIPMDLERAMFQAAVVGDQAGLLGFLTEAGMLARK